MSPSPTHLTPDRVAVHTITCKPMPLEALCIALRDRGFGAVSMWRDAIEEAGGADAARQMSSDAGLRVPALVRGGFFVTPDTVARAAAIDENKRCIDEAAAVGADMVVIVPGAHPGLPLVDARSMVTEGMAACIDHARSTGVALALEPLHPMYAGDRSCVNTLAQARAICEQLGDAGTVGVAIDVYHIWWDPDLEAEIEALGNAGLIKAFHTCDWLSDTANRLTDRGLMGDGVIDLSHIRRLVEATGFDGFCEVEVIGERYWKRDQDAYLDLIAERCTTSA